MGPAPLVDEDLFEGADAAARAIRAAFDAWRIGRGMPVDRAVLQESDAVSDTFIDEVTRLAKRVDGNSASLIKALEDGEVNRWRQDKTEELRTYLLHSGYLSAEEPLTREDIRLRVVAAVNTDLEKGRIDESLVDRIVGTLPE